MSTALADFGELRIELAEPNERFDPRRAHLANGLPAFPPAIDRIGATDVALTPSP